MNASLLINSLQQILRKLRYGNERENGLIVFLINLENVLTAGFNGTSRIE